MLIIGAHIGNWEASALAAQMYVPDVDMTFKTPRIGAIADKLVALRSSSGAGLISADASIALRVRDALKQGHMVGILVDEYYAHGIPVTMFNRNSGSIRCSPASCAFRLPVSRLLRQPNAGRTAAPERHRSDRAGA